MNRKIIGFLAIRWPSAHGPQSSGSNVFSGGSIAPGGIFSSSMIKIEFRLF